MSVWVHLSAVYLGLFSSIRGLQGVVSSQSSCLIGFFGVMDSLAIERMAPCCTGRTLQFPQNVFALSLCLHGSESRFIALWAENKCYLSTWISLVNFFFTSEGTRASKQFRADNV